MNELLRQLAGDPMVNNAIVGVVALGLLDWLLGTLRAIRDGIFKLTLVDVWVRQALLGRIIPIVLILAFSRVVGGIRIGEVDVNTLAIAGTAAAVAYATTTVQSIIGSLNPMQPNKLPPAE